jgi:hypothetical protein
MKNLELRDEIWRTIRNFGIKINCTGEISDKRIDNCTDKILALIGKCATPTFSGGEKVSAEAVANQLRGSLKDVKLLSDNEVFPTEQKEYCSKDQLLRK